MPVMMVVRAGAQTGAFDQQFKNRWLFFANASKFGVREYSSP
jgi:hypothetical protein